MNRPSPSIQTPKQLFDDFVMSGDSLFWTLIIIAQYALGEKSYLLRVSNKIKTS